MAGKSVTTLKKTFINKNPLLSKMSKRVKQKGPKYQRYFYAYSDRMLVKHVDAATFLMQDALISSGRAECTDCLCLLGPKIPITKSILAMELPDVKGDIGARYGIIFVPQYKAKEFIEHGPPHKQKTLGPRELDSPASGLAYLTDFNPRHSCIGNDGVEFSYLYDGSFPIAYRKPATMPTINEIIDAFYPQKLSVPFTKRIGNRTQTNHIYLHSTKLENRLGQTNAKTENPGGYQVQKLCQW